MPPVLLSMEHLVGASLRHGYRETERERKEEEEKKRVRDGEIQRVRDRKRERQGEEGNPMPLCLPKKSSPPG